MVRAPSMEDVEAGGAALLSNYDPETTPALRRQLHELKAADLQCGGATEMRGREVQRTAQEFRKLAQNRRRPGRLEEFAAGRNAHDVARHIYSVALGSGSASLGPLVGRIAKFLTVGNPRSSSHYVGPGSIQIGGGGCIATAAPNTPWIRRGSRLPTGRRTCGHIPRSGRLRAG